LARSWYMFFFQLPWLPEALFRAGNYRMLLRAFRQSAVHKDAFTDEDIEQYRAAFKNPYSATAAINYYRAMFRSALRTSRADRERAMRKIAAPTMLIWGEQDVALRKEADLQHGRSVHRRVRSPLHPRLRPLGAAGEARPRQSVPARVPRSARRSPRVAATPVEAARNWRRRRATTWPRRACA